ncbi:DUF3160 domain-containing protein, partial [candidate division KSB1 bacterium]|nr:DUF3160 domain-containing protein [candidate division KSB1 bacterium]
MKPLYRFLFLGVLFVPCIGQAQSGFSPQAYSRYLEQTANLSAENLLQQNPLPAPIFSRLDAALHPKEFAYFDSLVIKYGLTTDEIDLLQEHHFVVTERLNFDCFGRALHDIYIKDLPVFVTTDAVLHALHASYDRLLMDLESAILEPNLVEAFDGLARAYHLLQNKYESKRELVDNLGDVDTYITVARSLLAGEALAPVGPYSADIREILQAIEAEQVAFMPLFCDRSRRLDFSQFTVRGHYTQELPSGKTLANYFRCMMWLGRIDFL